jgi:aspartokinase/homoserine dehydrogenase 1
LANSKKMLIQESGIDLDNWKNELNDKGEKFTQKGLIQNAKTLNLRNSVLVDCTANYDIAAMYLPALESNISVVTANKIAASDKYEAYQKLKKVALKNGAHYLFETNVGAGLPVIRTINDLIHSGDRVQKIEATVSGSLNFIYNNYDGTTSFHDIVKQAQKEGYTEPDPRIDLSGVDVKRKILILARESGFKMELDDIKVKDILPKSCFEVESVDDFFEELKKYEGEFKAMVEKAQSENKKLRVIAGFDGKEATVELMAVDQAHPFYSLQGTDNVVALYTDRYASQPMVIQGAGAGAGVTAAGVFADIIRVVNY